MKDPIKNFVQEHREDFDHLEPSPEVLQRLKAQLRPTPVVKQSFFKRYQRTNWLAAASLLVGMIAIYLLTERQDAPTRDHASTVTQQPILPTPADSAVVRQAEKKSADHPTEDRLARQDARPKTGESLSAAQTGPAKPSPASLATRLADSSSASIRLAAILEIEQSGKMDDTIREMLAATMNKDGNTNVRLAALDVLSRHLQDPQVADVFASSLATQDDPLVQLGIVKVAAQIDQVGIEEALFALARDPYTFAAVRDEIYAVLLNQNKL
ncbi:HEAT repeat domain-containing protein [Parapedobacter koreensis]|uniref:HEAT repeat-containing protein n=1 Tax=Parapedobacter koreensis TaxID=332977 RepID=A0A1H7QMY9_9SPHI|nr:HEAT repeat domain-containing protein [Parapedobacter koreensis]SEL49293.1 HEAT repeat-containing protein [Parapedobacter koreensis]